MDYSTFSKQLFQRVRDGSEDADELEILWRRTEVQFADTFMRY